MVKLLANALTRFASDKTLQMCIISQFTFIFCVYMSVFIAACAFYFYLSI